MRMTGLEPLPGHAAAVKVACKPDEGLCGVAAIHRSRKVASLSSAVGKSVPKSAETVI